MDVYAIYNHFYLIYNHFNTSTCESRLHMLYAELSYDLGTLSRHVTGCEVSCGVDI